MKHRQAVAELACETLADITLHETLTCCAFDFIEIPESFQTGRCGKRLPKV
jgi:hypothetical protein